MMWNARAAATASAIFMHEGGEIWASIGHPVNPDKLAFAVGTQGSTFNDHGMYGRGKGVLKAVRR